MACFTALALQMPDIFSNSEEFQAWFDSWASHDTEAQPGTGAARAAQREEQVCPLAQNCSLCQYHRNQRNMFWAGHALCRMLAASTSLFTVADP